MDVTTAILAVRTATEHDSDTQVTDTQLTALLNLEYGVFYRQVALVAPSFYATTDDNQTLASGATDLDPPADFDLLLRVERLYGADWLAVPVFDGLAPHLGELNIREEDATIKVGPAALAAGTYRIIYIPAPDVTLATTEAYWLPPGCEDVLIQRACSRVAERDKDDSSMFIRRGDANWAELKKTLRKRYGQNPVPGLVRVRNW